MEENKTGNAVRTHQCTICDKLYARSSDQRMHISCVHDSRRTLRCTTCSNTFSRPANLKRHISIVHSAVKQPFKCPLSICGLGFEDFHKLKMHVAAEHKGANIHLCRCSECG